jgi:hypothetical protein
MKKIQNNKQRTSQVIREVIPMILFRITRSQSENGREDGYYNQMW